MIVLLNISRDDVHPAPLIDAGRSRPPKLDLSLTLLACEISDTEA